jgi:DNA topoisomerase IA
MTIRVGDRVRHRDPVMHSYWGEGIVRYADASVVSWLTDNGTGDRSTAGNHVPCVITSQMIRISKPGDPPMRYGPYKPIPKALP